MKNKLKYLLLLLCLVVSTKNVYAYDNNTVFTNTQLSSTKHKEVEYGSSAENASGNPYNNLLYYVTSQDNNSERYFAYCADPHLSAGKDLVIDHILMDEDGSNYTKAGDYGLLTILSNGEWNYVNKPSTPSESVKYEATSMAVRMYVNGVLGLNYRHTSKNVFKAYLGTLYSWLNNDADMAEAKKNYELLTGYTDLKYIFTQYNQSSPTQFFYFKGTYGTEIEKLAKQYLKEGLAAAVAYKNGKKAPTVSISTAGGSDISSQGNRYESLVIASISLKDFNGEGYFNYKGINSINTSNTSVEELGYSFDYSTNASTYTNNGKLSSATNLVALLEEKEKDIVYIAYKVVLNNGGLDKNCNAKFEVEVEYNHDSLLNGAVLVTKGDGGKDYTDGQRFIIYSNSPIQKEIELNAKMCDSTCDPEIGLPQICYDEDTPDANGNVTYEYHEGVENGQKNIEKCILGNTDSAGNSYKLVEDKDAASVSANPYCAVYCKEEYKFTMPYKATVVNGRYFQIGMEIEGQQDCYTTKIDTNKFNANVSAAQKDIVDAYNKWLKYYELVNNDLSESRKYLRCTKSNCVKETEIDPETGEVTDFTCNKSGQTTIRNEKKLEIKFVGNYYVFNESTGTAYVSASARPASVEFGKVNSNSSGTCKKNESTNSCDYKETTACNILSSQEDYDNQLEDFKKEEENARKNLSDAVKKLENIIKQYNSCIDGWDVTYLFDPEIKYYYDEPNPNSSGDKYMNLEGCAGAACDVMVSSDKKVVSGKCDSDDESCTKADYVNTIFGNDRVLTTEYCTSVTGGSYECINPQANVTYNTVKYLTCTVNGLEDDNDSESQNVISSCGLKEYQVTNLSYVHKVATASAKYTTPRVFYSLNQNAEVVIETDSQKINSSGSRYNLVDGLPVGANTPAGTYFYILSINNLGRYYDSHRLGRIFGSYSNSLSTVERLEREETINGEELKGNEYACTYNVNQSCTDDKGTVHSVEECSSIEGWDGDWNSCKKTLCPEPEDNVTYCVKEAQSYYVCNSQYYDSSCVPYNTRDEAINNSVKNYNCCPNCEIFCVGSCIYTIDDDGKSNLMLEFRPISPALPNPNDRHLGYNWDVNNPTNKLVARKAENTLYEITTRANIDVENATEEQLKEVESYSMKIKLTPEMTTWIREYNQRDDVVAAGSYNNDTLECYDYKLTEYTDEASCKSAGYIWEKDSCIMSNIFCYSKFIDELEAEFEDEVDSPNRAEAKSSAHDNYKVYKNFKNLPSQETQIITINDYWTIYRYTTLYAENSSVPLIGPSWK